MTREKVVKGLGIVMVWAVILIPLVGRTATDEATSVIVNIQRSATEVSSKVHEGLTRQITEMVARWEENLRKTLALYERAKKEGQPALVSQFEDQLSRTMQEAAQDLASILTQQEPATTGLHKLDMALTEGLKFFRERGTQVQAETAKLVEDREKLETQLRDLAQRHRHIILNGQLPPEVDALVRELEAQRRTFELRAQVKQQTAEVAAVQVRELDRYAAEVRWLRGLSRETFTQARGQLLVLGDLAELRRLGVSVAQLSHTVIQFKKATVDFSETVQKGEGLLDQLRKLPLPGGFTQPEESPTVDLKRGQGTAILKGYLEHGRRVSKPEGRRER